MIDDGDDDDPGGRLHRRHVDRHADLRSGSVPPPAPGKTTLTQRLPFAAPSAAARTAVSAAVGAARRVATWAPSLMASIAASDYVESGRVSFEIRSALRRAETVLADLEQGDPEHAAQLAGEITAARAQLAAQRRELALLLRAAPVFEDPAAGTASAEAAWREARRAAAPRAKPADLRGAWAADAHPVAAALGLGDVSIEVGDNARAATDAENARGVAVGTTVHLHPDRVQPGTPEGREVLAHELVHLAQARLSADQDAGRDAAEAEAADIARMMASRGVVRQPVHHIDLSRAAADTHARVPVPSGTVDARGYINARGNAVRINEAIVTAIAAMHLPDPPAERLTWKESAPFRSRLCTDLARVLGRAAKAGGLAERLVDLTYPAGVLDALDENRPRLATAANTDRVLGPDAWVPSAGRAVADTVTTVIAEAVVRLAAQYVATADAADRRRAEDGWESAYVLVPSHPIDERIAAAMLGDDQGKSVFSVTPAPKESPRRERSAKGEHGSDTRGVPRGWRAVTVRWQGKDDPALWNWLLADPSDATAEEVSASLYDGDTSQAAWLTAAPPFFALHPARARAFAAAWSHRPEKVAPLAADAADTQSLGALVDSAAGERAAVAQGVGVELEDRSKAGAPDARTLLMDVGTQLLFLGEALSPWSLAGTLGPGLQFEARCQTALATATGAEATTWHRVIAGWRSNLSAIAGDVGALAAAGTPSQAGSIHDVLAEYARAAAAAHLATTGQALLATARQRRARLTSDATMAASRSASAAVDGANAATEVADQGVATRAEQQGAVLASTPPLWQPMVAGAFAIENEGDESRAELRRERAALVRDQEALDDSAQAIRADAIAGKPNDADASDEALLRADEVQFRARTREIRIRVLELRHEAFAVDKGLLSAVVDALDGQISSLQDLCAFVRTRVDEAGALLHTTGSTATQELSAAESRSKRREALVEARAMLDRLGGEPLVVRFLEHAPRIIQRHQFRVAVLNLAVSIGVGFAAAAAGAWAARAAVGAEAAGGVTGAAVHVGTEALVNTVANAALTGRSPEFRHFIENAIAGAASRLIMHPFAAGAGGRGGGLGNVWRRSGARLVLDKAIEVGGGAVLEVAINYAALMASSLADEPSQKTVDEWIIDGLGVALGRFVHGHMERMESRLKALPDAAAKQLAADAKALAAAARRLEGHPTEENARAVLDKAQVLTEHEQALHASHAATTSDTAGRAAAVEARLDADALQTEGANFDLRDLREVVPGKLYAATPELVSALKQRPERYGLKLVLDEEQAGRVTFERDGKTIIVETRAAAPRHRTAEDQPATKRPQPEADTTITPAERAARQAKAAAELATIPVSVAPTAHASQGYLVTHADGRRMADLFRHLDGADVIEYKAGLLVRLNGKEWYFQFDDKAHAREGTAGERDAQTGLPASNVATVEIYAYTGVRHINGRPETEWTKAERDEVEDEGNRDPLIRAGHVAISFDGGKTLFGMTPNTKGVPANEVVPRLKKNEVFPGTVKLDNRHFDTARKMATSKGWDTDVVRVVVTFDPAEGSAIAEQVFAEMTANERGENPHGYTWPFKAPRDGRYYDDGVAPDGRHYAADDVGNCAMYPAMVGVPIPENSGRMQDYKRELNIWASADAPVAGRPLEDKEPRK